MGAYHLGNEDSDSSGLEWGLRFCISNQLRAGASAVGYRTAESSVISFSLQNWALDWPATTFRLWFWERIFQLSISERVGPLFMFLCLHTLLKYGCMYFLLSLFSEERNDWIAILLNALKSQSPSHSQAVVVPEKCGYLELRGYKAKIFTVLSGNSVWLCKNEQVSYVTIIANCGSFITLTTVTY